MYYISKYKILKNNFLWGDEIYNFYMYERWDVLILRLMGIYMFVFVLFVLDVFVV